MNKKNLIIIFLITIGVIVVPLLIFAWYLLPPEVVLPRLETSLVYQGAVSGQYSDPVELRASLSEIKTQTAVVGREVRFVLEGQNISAITNAQGLVTVFLNLNQSAATYTLSTIFAGDEQFHGSSTTTPFNILKENNVLTYTGPSSGVEESTITLSARLSEIDPHVGNLEGKVIIFELDRLSIETRTDRQGEARANLKLDLAPGIYTLRTRFPGSATYLSSVVATNFEVIRIPRDRRCFIATVAFDSSLSSELDILRQFRDKHLLTNWPGTLIVHQYEQYSPFLADLISENETLKKLTKIGLKLLIEILPQ